MTRHYTHNTLVLWRCALQRTDPHLTCCCPAGKEYSKADSRYATRDDFVISMEAVTAFIEGPGCLLIVWGLLKAKPWRYTAVLLVSLGQFYGDVLYFGTCLHGGEPQQLRLECYSYHLQCRDHETLSCMVSHTHLGWRTHWLVQM